MALLAQWFKLDDFQHVGAYKEAASSIRGGSAGSMLAKHREAEHERAVFLYDMVDISPRETE
jgi:hypothetical protein